MAYKLKDLRAQYLDVIQKYDTFRDNPSDKLEEEYKLSLDTLESMIPIYETGSSKKTNSTKHEKAFLTLIKNRDFLEGVIKSNYDFGYGLRDNFIKLEDAEKILKLQKASKGKSFDLEDVLKKLGIDIEEN